MSVRRLATIAGVTAGMVAAFAVPRAAAQELGVGWQGEFRDSRIVDGYEATGTELVIPVTFEFDGPPGSVITDITLELEPAGDLCDGHRWVQPLDEGDGDGSTTPPTSAPPAPQQPEQPGATVRADWTFRVDPRCNGTYDIAVFARADPAGTLEPGDPGTESDPLTVERARISLDSAAPEGVSAEPAGDRKVTVRWQAPADWSPPPDDAIGYRVQRVAPDGTVTVVGDDLILSATSIVDDAAATAPPGRYEYQVIAMRRDGDGDPLLSRAASASVELAAPAPPVTGRSGGAVPSARVGRTAGPAGQPAVAPEYDPGFADALPYDEDLELGPEEAVPPADLSLLDVPADEPVGEGFLVPGAIALCLAVWAGHLRHLARRAAPPIP